MLSFIFCVTSTFKELTSRQLTREKFKSLNLNFLIVIPFAITFHVVRASYNESASHSSSNQRVLVLVLGTFSSLCLDTIVYLLFMQYVRAYSNKFLQSL